MEYSEFDTAVRHLTPPVPETSVAPVHHSSEGGPMPDQISGVEVTVNEDQRSTAELHQLGFEGGDDPVDELGRQPLPGPGRPLGQLRMGQSFIP